MRVTEHDTLDSLQNDLQAIVRRAPRDMVAVVRKNVTSGNRRAKAFAKERSRAHGKHYPNAFSAEMHPVLSLGLVSGEFGPEADKRQGDMSFERGSRNQPAHHELADTADIIGPKFAKDAVAVTDKWFWAGSQ